MLLASLQKRLLINLLSEEDIDLEGTLVKIVFPTSMKNIVNRRKRRLRNIFKEIEEKIRKRADPTYEEIEEFREIGGYSLIKKEGFNYLLESIFETEGEAGKQVVIPGRGLDLRWSCAFPHIKIFDICWESVVSFIKYHSHPFTNYPHPQDITVGIRNLKDIPENVEYIQTIYSKNWTPKFLWLKHYNTKRN